MIIVLLWGSTSKDRGRRQVDTQTKTSKGHDLRTKKVSYFSLIYFIFFLFSSQKGQGNVDAIFFEKIKKLINVVVPKLNCKESKYLVILSLLLVLRTYMSIWLADVNGKIVKSIVERNFRKFLIKVSQTMPKFIINFICLDIKPAFVCNPLISSQFCIGLFQQAASDFIQRENHRKIS